MEVTTLITPFPKGQKKPPLAVPVDALSFLQHQQAERTMNRHYKVTLKDAHPLVSGLYQFKITDGLRRNFEVEVLKGVVQCSCKEFYEEQAGYCEHAALISLIWNQPAFYPLTWQLIGEIKARKKLVKLGLPFEYRYYSGKTNSIETVAGGRTPTKGQPAQVVESCTIPNYTKVAQGINQLAGLPSPVSQGILLSGLNLYPYQEDIFQKMLVANKAICSMKMGAGKTLTTLACYGWVLKNLNPSARMLVICPKSLKIQWQNEIKRALALPSFLVNDKKGLAQVGSHQIEIVTYQTFTKHCDVFTQKDYDIVVMDEIQFIRNSESKAWKAAKEINTKFFYGLSGTVIENRLDDLYSIMEIVSPGALGPKWRFSTDYQNLLSVGRKVIIFDGVKNLPLLHEKLKDRVFSYGDLQLPPITHTYVPVRLTGEQSESHDQFYGEAQKLLAKSMTSGLSYGEKMYLQAMLLKARQACNSITLITKKPSQLSSKLQEVCSIARASKATGKKVIFFSQWTEMLDLIADEFRALGAQYVFYTGRESEVQRDRSLERFTQDPNVLFFLASDSGGVGLDGLQKACDVVVHVEPPWNPARIDQRTGRVYRIGQVNPVSVFYLYGRDSIEQKMLDTLQKKRDIRTSTLDFPVEELA